MYVNAAGKVMERPFKYEPPKELQSEKRAEYLRVLFRTMVKELEGHWKGRVQAKVPGGLANDVHEAMNFHGALVDKAVTLPSGQVYLYSDGYWAHGF